MAHNRDDYRFKKGVLISIDGPVRNFFTFQYNPTTMQESQSPNYSVTKPIQSEQALYQHISFNERTLKFELFLNGREDFAGQGIGINSKPFLNLKDKRGQNLARAATDSAIQFGARRVPFAESSSALNNPLTGNVLDNQIGARLRNTAPLIDPTRNVMDDLDFLDSLIHGSGDRPPPFVKFDWERYNNVTWIVTNLDYDFSLWSSETLPLHVRVNITLKQIQEDTNRKKETIQVAQTQQTRLT